VVLSTIEPLVVLSSFSTIDVVGVEVDHGLPPDTTISQASCEVMRWCEGDAEVFQASMKEAFAGERVVVVVVEGGGVVVVLRVVHPAAVESSSSTRLPFPCRNQSRTWRVASSICKTIMQFLVE
jgi:hypothetical protein